MKKSELSLMVALLMAIGLAAGTRAEVIQAGIEHKEYLPPVAQSYKAGARFSAPAQVARVAWFPVPDWLAGAWLKPGDMETYVRDFRTGQETTKPIWLDNKVRLAFGHQRDCLGTVWHAEVLPFRADGNRGPSTDRRYVMDMSCLKSQPDMVSLRFHSNVFQVDPEDGEIETTTQQEEIVTFRPDKDGVIASTSSTRTFDENGHAIIQSNSNAGRSKLADFVPVNELNGINLVESLTQFLTSNNMTNRLSSQ
ncbi:MAG: hypothetical protein K2X93_19935 [Candidatus Obscuribacterales bacterium]|nr:hypothetical protein [Candidatus Obscuribacterales bacterium]